MQRRVVFAASRRYASRGCASWQRAESVLFCALGIPRRALSRLYTSYYGGQLFPNQLVQRVQRLPAGVGVRDARHGVSIDVATTDARCTTRADKQSRESGTAITEGVLWGDVESTDLIHGNMHGDTVPREVWRQTTDRPYAPLSELAKLELQGDYLSEGDMHQASLEYYGVVAKAYQLIYPDNHPQRVGILLKLAGAFRRTGRLQSSKANLELALKMLDASSSSSAASSAVLDTVPCTPAPSLELVVEALLELGLTKEALGEADAGATFEEALAVINAYHRIGESHRMLRLLPRLARRFTLNVEEKFRYYSPFDYDRTFALADQCLARAEAFYRHVSDAHGVVRVLQAHKELLDRKFFNMRDFAGRIHTMRGHWMRRANVLTNAPTPDELLRYSPTIHQVYRDFRYELNAPIGRESEVQQGVNRVVLDMGNPYRRYGARARRMMRDADRNFARYVRPRDGAVKQEHEAG